MVVGHATAHVWSLEDNYQKLVLPILVVGIELRSQLSICSSKYSLSHLAGPDSLLFMR